MMCNIPDYIDPADEPMLSERATQRGVMSDVMSKEIAAYGKNDIKLTNGCILINGVPVPQNVLTLLREHGLIPELCSAGELMEAIEEAAGDDVQYNYDDFLPEFITHVFVNPEESHVNHGHSVIEIMDLPDHVHVTPNINGAEITHQERLLPAHNDGDGDHGAESHDML